MKAPSGNVVFALSLQKKILQTEMSNLGRKMGTPWGGSFSIGRWGEGLEFLYQFSPLKIIQSHADLASDYLKSLPNPPLQRGGRGDF
jgi:hypothetical protein